MTMNKSGIYMIKNKANGKFYIGSSVNVGHRWYCDHRVQLRGNCHPNCHLQRSWNKHGESNFDFLIIEEIDVKDKTKEEAKTILTDREQYYIDTMKAAKCGYNLCPKAGSSLGRINTETIITRKKLLAMAKSGKDRPRYHKDELATQLCNYTNSNSCSYDKKFNNKIRKLRPDWFVDTVAENKKVLLKIAVDGRARPSCRTIIGNALCYYTNSKKIGFDDQFDKQIRSLRPDWFVDTAAENKKMLLAMASDNKEKPSTTTAIGRALYRYTTKDQLYDEEFDTKVRSLRPDWFVCEVTDKKQQLLEIARRGEPKPHQKTHPLGNALWRYTIQRDCYDCYDSVFDAEIRALRPDWFCKSININKEKILELARNGEPRPNQKHPLRTVLCRYTNKNDRRYDPEFDSEIRSLRPDWFVDTVTENKKELLEMARRGELRPSQNKHSLGGPLSRYTTKRSYDPEFDKQIRGLRPDWFNWISFIACVGTSSV